MYLLRIALDCARAMLCSVTQVTQITGAAARR
jgi:hypothetical protein